MNDTTYGSLFARLLYRAIFSMRHLGATRASTFLGTDLHGDTIQRIYVINLDRHSGRWHQIRRELARLNDRSGKPLAAITERFSAVDARCQSELPDGDALQPHYSLAEQLFVEPHSLPLEDAGYLRIEMTRQEIAVALSHVGVWQRIAANEQAYALVLEDDVYFRRNFARMLERAWAELEHRGCSPAFDLLYLSYKETRGGAPKEPVSDLLFRPLRGLWQLSGYALSKRGALRLLSLLPVRGPVDLWINHQFQHLDVLATRSSIVEQRLDCPSANSYSILPVLSGRGVLMREKPLLPRANDLPSPVFAFGRQGTGLTALTAALSMVGYRCCSNVTALPESERERLFSKKRGRIFDAYVNVGSLQPDDYIQFAKLYRKARFIITTDHDELGEPVGRGLFEDGSAPDDVALGGEGHYALAPTVLRELQRISGSVLVLPVAHRDKWALLCAFLGFDYPSHLYPEFDDQGQRQLAASSYSKRPRFPEIRRLRSDTSPWVAPRKDWRGVTLTEHADVPRRSAVVCERFEDVHGELWMLRDDTFPSNLALFRPTNLAAAGHGVGRLTLREESTAVRGYTSASVCSRRSYLYGRFVAEIRPANVAGLVTGVFLHRNTPRQEIDMEFLGKDTTKLLVNVFYNPGYEGARLEYGYRGTPALIDLGFDAAHDFHRYEIEWDDTCIRWRVDGHVVCQRANWDPTPIPHLPMQFHVNLWHSRSKELAGKLAGARLPAHSELRRIEICA